MDKEEIIAAAVELFQAKGYHATSVREIAEKLGVTSAALYYHLNSKEQLLTEIFEKAMTVAERRLDRVLSLDLPPQERLERIIREHVWAALEEAPLMAVFFNEVQHLPPESYHSAVEREKNYQDRIIRIFKDAVASGLLEDIDIELAVFGILGMCNWLHRWYRPEGRKTPDEIGEIFAQMVLHGLCKKGG